MGEEERGGRKEGGRRVRREDGGRRARRERRGKENEEGKEGGGGRKGRGVEMKEGAGKLLRGCTVNVFF